MNLLQLSKELQKNPVGKRWNMLIYGHPRSKKTGLAATIALRPEIKKVWWFDLENGIQTLSWLVRTGKMAPEIAEKIITIRVADNPKQQLAYETVAKALSVRGLQRFCEAHGREIANCIAGGSEDCCKDGDPFVEYDLGKIGEDEVIVFDGGTNLGDSVINYVMRKEDMGSKPSLEQYGHIRRILAPLFQYIRAARQNIIMTAHAVPLEMVKGSDTDIFNPIKDGAVNTVQKLFPSVGSAPFSVTVGGYFQNIVYTDIALRKHVAHSDVMAIPNVLTGSRNGWKIEAEKGETDLGILFDRIKQEGGKV